MFCAYLRGGISVQSVFGKADFWRTCLTVSSLLISCGTYIVIMHKLGPSVFGVYIFAQWLATMTLPFLGTGTATLASRQMAVIQRRQPPRVIAGIFYFLWYRQCRSILLYCVLYLALALPLARLFSACSVALLLLAILSVLPLLLSSIVGITLRSLQRCDLLRLLYLLGSLLTFLFVLIVARLRGEHSGLFLLSAALANTLTLCMSLSCILHLLPLKDAQRPSPILQDMLTCGLRCSSLLFIADVIVWQRGTLVLLAYQRNPTEVGFYAISALIGSSTIQIAPAILSHRLASQFFHFLPVKYPLHAYEAFVRTCYCLALLAIPLCAIALFLCPILVTGWLGSAYQPLVMPLRISLIAGAFGSIATASYTHLANHRQLNKLSRPALGIALFHLILAWPCIVLWGATGAAIASALAQIISALSSLFICNRYLRCAQFSPPCQKEIP